MKSYILKFIKNKGFILIFILIIGLPLFQSYTQLFNDQLLNEKRAKTPNPTYNKEEPLSKYIINQEKYFEDNLGFREYFIRLSNFIDVNIFNKSPNPNVVIGKNDYLYSGEELVDYNRDNILSDEDINIIATKLITLQNDLKARGMDFIFTVAPNKSTIYPEYMPSDSLNPNIQSNLEKLEKAIGKNSINYIDYKNLMLENKDTYDLYYKRDTHWNTIAATLAANELIEKIDSYNAVGEFNISPINIKEEFRQGDLDDLLGLKTPLLEKTCETDISVPKNKIPKTLAYNDSFYNEVLPMLDGFFVQRMDIHNFNAPLHSNFPQFSQNAEIVVFEVVERYIYKLIDYNFDIFNDDISKVSNYPSTNLNLYVTDMNNKVALKDVAFYPYDNYFGFSSLSEDSKVTWDVDKQNLNYILLEFENARKHENVLLTFADSNEEFKEKQAAAFMLIPNKTTYLIEVKYPIEISKFRLNISNKSNVDLNLKEIKLISSP